MKKKIILHIGCEKTGTTSIQNSMFLNRDLLKLQNNILYPRCLGGKNHWKMGVYAANEDKNLTKHIPRGKTLELFRRELESEFVKEACSSDADTILISNEWLHSRIRNEDEFQRLRGFLSLVSEDIQVLMYIRRQDKMAVSLYSTALKAGRYHPFSFPTVSEKKPLPYYYDFLTIYKNWVSLVGKKSVTLRVFDKGFLYKGDVVKDFINELGIDETGIVYMAEDNSSLTLLGSKMLRLVNYILLPFENKLSHRFKKKIRYKVASFFSGKLPIDLDANEAKLFLSAFSDCNSTLVADYKKNRGKDLNF